MQYQVHRTGHAVMGLGNVMPCHRIRASNPEAMTEGKTKAKKRGRYSLYTRYVEKEKKAKLVNNIILRRKNIEK